jgi:DNA-binding CsgD family transcriptional regulator
VLVCAPDSGPARALADAHRGAPADSLRVARSGGALRGIRGDLVVTTRADAIAVAPAPDGALCAETVAGTAVNTLLHALVDSLWDGALPPANAEHIEEIGRDPVKLEILRLLENGAKDEVIARGLGVSLRTCRRHIAELLSAADAVSRFQAASRLARAGLLSAPSPL